jgi:hypothetical protein
MLVAAIASTFGFGCATLPPPDVATVAAAAAAATAATTAAGANAAPSAGAAPAPALAPGAARPAANSPAIAAAAAAAAAVASQQKPFAEVVKDAKEQPGFFNLYSKEEKVWLEIKPDQFDQPFFLQVNRTNGIGDRDPFRSPMLRSYIVEFHRLGSLVQLIARNSQFFATAGTPLARAVRESTSDSLISAVPVASQPHPERKSVLIDANSLLLADIPGGSTALEAAYHIAYGFDARNSSFTATHNTVDLTGFAVSAHYSVPKLPPAPSMTSPSRSAAPAHLEDERSLFLGYYYSLAKLPEAMAPRIADDRLGHFMTRRWDFSSDSAAFPEVYYVKRWRLEKKDPAAEMSEPKVPIVYWLDRNIPEKYRETIKAGVLEWNKAFEKIGFKDAIRVEVQADDAPFSTADARHASIRWVVRDELGALAIGPSRADPRTGEILDADIEIEDGWTRVPRRQASEQFAPRVAQPALGQRDMTFCEYGDVAMDELAFALDLLVARGEIAPDSQRREIRLATLKRCGDSRGRAHAPGCSTAFAHRPSTPRSSFRTRRSPGATASPGRSWTTTPSTWRWDEPQGDYAHALDRALRLLGDRIRVQADRARRGEGRAGENCRPKRRAATGLWQRHRRRLRRVRGRHGSAGQSSRLGERSARLRDAPAEALARAVGASAGAPAETGRELRDAAAQLPCRPHPTEQRGRRRSEICRRRCLCARPRR